MIAEAVKSIADLLEIILPILNITLVGGDVKTDLTKLEPQIRNEIQWTGQKGYLVYVPVGMQPSTGQLIYDGLRPKGSGESQEAILASSIGKSLEQAPPKFLSDEHTFYIWYDGKTDTWSIVPPEFVEPLKVRALALKNDTALLSSIEDKRKNDIFARAVEVLQDRAKDDAIKKFVLETSQKLKEHKQRIADIEAKLSAALDKAKQAAAFQERLQMMKNVVSVGELAVQAKDLVPDAGVKNGDSYVTIDQKVKEYKAEQDGLVLRMRQQMAVQIKLTNEEAAKLRPLLKQNGAPPEITDWSL